MVGTHRSSPPHPLTLGCAFVKFQTHAEAQAAINTLHSSRTLPVSPSPLLSLSLSHWHTCQALAQSTLPFRIGFLMYFFLNFPKRINESNTTPP